MSKISSISYENKNSVKGDIRTDIIKSETNVDGNY